MSIPASFRYVPVHPVAADAPLHRVDSPQAWYGRDMARRHAEWTHRLTDSEVTELRRAIVRVEAAGMDVVDLRAEDFPLPELGKVLRDVKHQLFDGRGFALLRGFPVEELTPLQRCLGYFGIGSHFGEATPQNAKGHALGHVCDLGVDYGAPTGRGYQTNARLPYHTDSADVVGLLCVNTAKSGGLNSVVSSVTLYNEMIRRRPDLARLLMGPVYRDRRDEIEPGQGPWYCIPVFNPFQGRVFSTHVRSSVRKAQRFAELPRISPQLDEAMDFLDALAEDPDFHLDMEFERGDMQFVCNHFLLHSRTGFEDHAEPERRRHLLRLHLACPDGPALPPVFENLRGYNRHGRPDGTLMEGVRLNAPLEPVDGGPGSSMQRLRAGQVPAALP
jgi:hypothetical protein